MKMLKPKLMLVLCLAVLCVSVYSQQITSTTPQVLVKKADGTSETLPTGKEILLQDRDYYVMTNGNDNNVGFGSFDSAHAYVTLQKAIDTVKNLDQNGHAVRINLADGTHSASTNIISGIPGKVSIVGNSSDPSAVVISTTYNSFSISKSNLDIRYLKLTSQAHGIYADDMSIVTYTGLDFGNTTMSHVCSTNGSTVYVSGDYKITGSAQHHFLAGHNARIVGLTNAVCTLLNNPSFSSSFIYALEAANATITSINWSGSAQGKRYIAWSNGVIQTYGRGANYFPGDQAGYVNVGGIYE